MPNVCFLRLLAKSCHSAFGPEIAGSKALQAVTGKRGVGTQWRNRTQGGRFGTVALSLQPTGRAEFPIYATVAGRALIEAPGGRFAVMADDLVQVVEDGVGGPEIAVAIGRA